MLAYVLGNGQLKADKTCKTIYEQIAMTKQQLGAKNRLDDGSQLFVETMLAKMTLTEKLGQMSQFSGECSEVPESLANAIREGRVGSILNQVDPELISQMQEIALRESRLGIPLLVGRDVIHGFNTIFPIPLAQAASWNPKLVESAAKIAATEASQSGINWTFSPMLDIGRDPRWGRIAESFGEDPYVCAMFGAAMIRGYQGDDLRAPDSIVACAKHFAAYGASESGRDYNTTNVSTNEMRNVHLPSFYHAVQAGVKSVMSGFNDVDGIPATANQWLLTDVLRDEWQFDGVVLSDWESVYQLCNHGIAATPGHAGQQALAAGVDMEMVSTCFADHLGKNSESQLAQREHEQIDQAVRRILHLKLAMGLFDGKHKAASQSKALLQNQVLETAKELALQSCVLLQNENNVLPLDADKLNSVAVLGPLADDEYEQLGTWIFDADLNRSQTCLQALQSLLAAKCEVTFCKALENTRHWHNENIAQAVENAKQADVAILFLGEESILSGEAHCRSELDLPGGQQVLLDEVAATGTPVVLVIMAGRSLCLQSVLDKAHAVVYAWHGGSMAGPAIADLLFGVAEPSGKLPISFPRKVGQIPLYYAQKPGGKPVTEHNYVHMNDFPQRAPQTSLGMACSHMDVHFSPQFCFGFGLSYTSFEYSELWASKLRMQFDESIEFSVKLQNIGQRKGVEVVQLYVRDLVSSVTRPVKELKRFSRIELDAGESKTVGFELSTQDLGFYDHKQNHVVEAGRFQVWIGGSSDADLSVEFELEGSTGTLLQ